MKRILPALLIAALLAAGLLQPSAVLACSVGLDFNPIESSDVVVGGRILGWEVIQDAIYPDPKSSGEAQIALYRSPNFYGPYTAIRLRMKVDHVFKGPAAPEIVMVTGNTFRRYGASDSWVGSSGACGAFDADPTNQYAVLGLYKDEFGRYKPSLVARFFIGDAPAGDRYDRALARIASFEPADDLPHHFAALGVGAGVLLLAASAYLLTRRIMTAR